MSDDGDDSPPRPKRKIKRVVVASSSDSDSDENVGVAGSRRKKLRVLSDDEEAESSGSSVYRAGTRRRRALPKLQVSDTDSDSSGWATEQSGGATVPAKSASGFASDSSEGNSDKCSICLLRFTCQEIGTPESCEHIFCLDCILEWSKNVNTCPVDRMVFNSIVVRACAGGRVLRTQPVQVAERRPSLDTLVIEDLTVCELCGSTEGEDTMLLCDRCDLGYHMQCLTPPLTEIPPDMWICPGCRDISFEDDDEVINMSEVEDIIDEFLDSAPPSGPRLSALRRTQDTRRSRRLARDQQPPPPDQPSTSRGRPSSTPAPTRRAATRRKYKRRRTKEVIVEYEVQQNGKFPLTKRVTRKVKKRKVKKRQPRTAARRSYVRASVRARLATLSGQPRAAPAAPAPAPALPVRRARAGIQPLSLLGNPNELDYFSDDGDAISEVASTAVARRPSAGVLSAYRQARRKLLAVPSPPHAAAAPDLLADILEQQTLLHSKNSVLTVSSDGNVSIKLQGAAGRRSAPKEEKVDLSKARASVKQTPSYPGGRGGGWGGGYRGTYHRDQTANFNRSGGYETAPAPASRASYGAYSGGGGDRGAQRSDNDYYDAYPRRPQYASDDGYFERNRRPAQQPFPAPQRVDPAPGRYSTGPAWQPYGPRPDTPPVQARHSFGGFENPVDMRMGQMPPAEAPRQLKPQNYRPLVEPPVFNFSKISDVEKSEDERSDSGLVIDTEKYDPTEPTHDDDSGDDEAPVAPVAPLPVPPSPPTLSTLDPAAANVLPNILDTAVRQVLQEHRELIAAPGVEPQVERSDDESDGDCPNFSIYSAASVHIANSSSALGDDAPRPRAVSLEDLVQEDDTPPRASPAAPPTASPAASPVASPVLSTASPAALLTPVPSTANLDDKRKSEEEYKEKVSKRCPITTNTRNPIKIKLHTPSLIKRQVSLYDDEEASSDAEPDPELPPATGAPATPAAGGDAPEPETGEPGTKDVMNSSDESLHISTDIILKDKTDDTQYEKEDFPQVKETCEKTERDMRGLSEEKLVTDKGEENNNENMAEAPEEAAEPLSPSAASSDAEAESEPRSPAASPSASREKMTESISETEDERSYTPCLDEQRPVDDARPTPDLGTELISEDEGHELFGEAERAPSASPAHSPAPSLAPSAEHIATPSPERRREKRPPDQVKKKKKKDSKRDGKEKGKSKKKGDVSFKKLSKSGKERNYRERSGSARSESPRPRRRKDKRKDLERYDVRSVVSDKRRKLKDAFGRDVSPRARSPSASPRRSASPARRSPSLPRRSPSPARHRRSPSGFRRSPSRGRKSLSRVRRSASGRRSASRIRRSPSPPRRSLPRRSPSPRGRRPSRRASLVRGRSPSLPRGRRSPIRVRRSTSPVRRRSISAVRRRSTSPARRRSGTPLLSPRRRKRRRSATPARSPPRRPSKKKKRARGLRRAPPSPVRVRRSPSPPSPASRPPSPRTPPEPELAPTPSPRRRGDLSRRRRPREHGGPSKEVFTSGDNILVSVSFKEQERDSEGERRRRRETRRSRRRRRRLASAADDAPKPVAIIDLERSPFRELTPSPKNVIVLSDSEPGEREPTAPPAPTAPAPPPVEPAPAPAGPKTPPSPAAATPAPAPAPVAAAPSPDAYDPFEPTRSPSPAADAPLSPATCARPHMTLEAAQRSNLSADDVLARRPLTPVEKVMALLQSTRDAEAAEAEAQAQAPPAPRIVLPSPTRAPPKLFPGKPSPIKSNPVKPMQAARLATRDDGNSPYSPGSSDFGELFEPPPRRTRPHTNAATVRKRGKTSVGVKMDDDNLKILDELPSSAVELQVKSKVGRAKPTQLEFLKKLNRQERVVEEVKLVLKPHYNKKRVTKEEYKDILRRAVPKICHNKSGEINPTKIQALVEAYVKKFRKKHKLGVA